MQQFTDRIKHSASNGLFIRKLLCCCSPAEMCRACFCALLCVFVALQAQSPRQQHEKWFAILEQMGFSLCRMPGDFAPDKGHDQGEQSGSSGCWDTFGPECCRDGGHNEQNHGQRSFHCTTCPDSLRPVKMKINSSL